MRDVYGSHLRVLAAVVNTHRPQNVLEIGGGFFSTGFLTAMCDRVVTVEPHPEWHEKVASAYPQAEVVSDIPSFAGFDLIFIDNGQDAAQPLGADRVAAIRHVLSQTHPLVVIHDAEVAEYADAIEEFATNYSVFPTAPDTCVVYP
jgi:predicted O-methyltransferase YrrM